MTTVIGPGRGAARSRGPARPGLLRAGLAAPRRLSLRAAGDRGDAASSSPTRSTTRSSSRFFKTPPSLQLERQDLRRPRQLLGRSSTSDVFWKVTWQHLRLDGGLDLLRLRPRLRRGARAAPRVRRPRRAARASCSSPRSSARSPPPTSGTGSTIPTSASSARVLGRPRHHRPADQLPRQRQHRAAVADRGERLEEFPFAMIMMMAGPADRARPAAARRQVDGASAWHRFWHVTFPHLQGRVDWSRCCCCGRQPQLLHHPLDHDRRRAGGRLGHLDHPDLRARLRPPALGRRRRPIR